MSLANVGYGMSADVDGKVPLVEALIACDLATVKLLRENGTTLENADMGPALRSLWGVQGLERVSWSPC